MAKYVTDSEFRRQVRVCLDENMSSEVLQYLEDVDTLSLDDIIDSKVEDAALSVVRSAPISKLGDISKSLDGVLDIAQRAPYKGVMRLPVDFERLVRFKMRGWPLALYGAQPPLSPYYEQANSEFSVFGTKDRPVVFLVPSADNASDLCAEIFCASSQHDVLDGCTYVAKPKKEEVILSEDTDDSDNGGNEGGNEGGSEGGNEGGNEGETPVEPDFVNLGLPSGTLWAKCNVGADNPEGFGNYFAWGETEPKSDYSWLTYKHSSEDYLGKITKYTKEDGITVLEDEDDAARVALGEGWFTPTRAQLWELVCGEYTIVEWTKYNGVNGHLITSKVNGNSIFLPAAGSISGSITQDHGLYGKYWSSTLGEGDRYACIMYSSERGYGMTNDKLRYEGYTIRPVFVPEAKRGLKKPIVEEEETKTTESWKILLGENLLRPTVYYAAYLTALAVNDDNAAEKLLATATSLIEN